MASTCGVSQSNVSREATEAGEEALQEVLERRFDGVDLLVEAKEGMARLRNLADWLEQEQPAAANSLREGLEECFTINRLGIPPSLHRCLATTNLIESPQSGVRLRTRRVCRWRDTAMVARWAAASLRFHEHEFRIRSMYGDISGANLLDWPLGYADLEPYYAKAEYKMGVTGTHDIPRLPGNNNFKVLAAAAKRVGYRQVHSGNMAINSMSRDGRPTCRQIGFCMSGRAIGAK